MRLEDGSLGNKHTTISTTEITDLCTKYGKLTVLADAIFSTCNTPSGTVTIVQTDILHAHLHHFHTNVGSN